MKQAPLRGLRQTAFFQKINYLLFFAFLLRGLRQTAFLLFFIF